MQIKRYGPSRDEGVSRCASNLLVPSILHSNLAFHLLVARSVILPKMNQRTMKPRFEQIYLKGEPLGTETTQLMGEKSDHAA